MTITKGMFVQLIWVFITIFLPTFSDFHVYSVFFANILNSKIKKYFIGIVFKTNYFNNIKQAVYINGSISVLDILGTEKKSKLK